MTNLKLSSKMHIMIIVTSLVVAIGIAMGIIFHFVSNGYFNYGAEYSSYYSVSVDYALIDYTDESKVDTICEKAFKSNGVSYYSRLTATTDEGGNFTYKFSSGTSAAKLEAAANAIDTAMNANSNNPVKLNYANFHKVETKLGNAPAIKFAAVALAAAVAFQFIYFVIRYRLTMALSALLADVHNLAIYVSLLAITRIPVGSSAVVFGVLTVIMTMIGSAFLFDRVRKNAKNEELQKLGARDLVDLSAQQSFINTIVTAVGIAAAAVVVLVLMAISALSVTLVVTPVVLALLSAVSSVYGSAFFIPATYPRFKEIGDGFKAKHPFKSAKKA